MMNFYLILLLVALFGSVLLWLFYSQANSTQRLAEKYLIQQLKDKDLSRDLRKKYELQLSTLLQNSNKSDNSFKVIAFIIVFSVPLSFYFYQQLGNPNAIDYVAPTSQQAAAQQQAPQMNMQEAIAKLEARLAENPDDVDGQMLYARSQISLKNYKKAVIAYRKAKELAPNEAVILTELAEAIALANNNRSFLGEPEGLLAKAVALDGNNQKALWLLGMSYYEKQDFSKTNELWSKLYAMMSDEAAKKQLATQLHDLRAKLGIEQKLEQTQEVATTTTIETKIKLSQDMLQALQGKSGVLFVYVKQAQGMPMPIAVVRHFVEQGKYDDFPLEISISNSDSLQQNRPLNKFSKVKIGARISFSANAMPQAGDLQSDEVVIDLAQKKNLELTISKIRK